MRGKQPSEGRMCAGEDACVCVAVAVLLLEQIEASRRFSDTSSSCMLPTASQNPNQHNTNPHHSEHVLACGSCHSRSGLRSSEEHSANDVQISARKHKTCVSASSKFEFNQAREGESREDVGPTKEAVRQALASVCQCYPAARPTRANLKQVFQFARAVAGEQ
jgi:Rit1 DUSP-like domain